MLSDILKSTRRGRYAYYKARVKGTILEIYYTLTRRH